MGIEMTNTFNIDGIDGAVRAAMLRGVTMFAEVVLTGSNERVPHDEGTLERSGKVDVAVVGGAVQAAVSYNTPYAARQHEETTWRHKGGRSAKFLETSMHTNSGRGTDIVATQVRRAL